MPTFVELVDGLTRRRLTPVVRDGRLGLVGDLSKVDAVVAVACRWHRLELLSLVAASDSGHVIGVCNRCGGWSFIRHDKTPRCRMTPGCKGVHVVPAPAPE
jgi:hypothetical protein